MAFAFLLAVCACGSAGPTSPAGRGPRSVYVSTTGSDQNDGTVTAPWLTLRHAVAQLHAGDTLYLRGGTYTGTENTIDSYLGTVRSGTSWSDPVTIAGYPSEVVIIQPPGPNVSAIRLAGGGNAYVIIQDLILDGVNSRGNDGQAIYLSDGSHHNRLQRLEVKNWSNFGIVFSTNNGNSPFNEVIDCRIHDNGTAGGAGTNGHGMYIFTSDNLIEGNEVYNNQGYGLHLYNNEGPRHVTRNTVRNNKFHDNGLHSGAAYGMVVAWGDANLVYNNVIYANPGGIQLSPSSSDTRVYNNTIYNNTPLEGILIQHASRTVVRDNILYGNGTDILDLGTGTTLSNNRGGP